MKRWFHWILRFALGLTLFGVVASQSLAPTAEPPLVAYFVTWHATMRGVNNDAGRLTFSAETTGSAIVRFKPNESFPGHLKPYDTRYLSVVITGKTEDWSFTGPPHYIYRSYETANPSEYSGLYVPSSGQPGDESQLVSAGMAVGKGEDGRTLMVFHMPFSTVRYVEDYAQSGDIDSRTGEPPPRTDKILDDRSPVFVSFYDPKLFLRALSAKDDSVLTNSVRFSVEGNTWCCFLPSVGGKPTQIQVEWTAEARRLGTCPCALNSN